MIIDSKYQVPAVVTPLGITGLGMIRSLVRVKVPVIAVDSNPHQPAFFSRFGEKIVCPFQDREDQLLDFFLNLGKTLKKSILLPTSDKMVSFISKYQKKLMKYFIFSIPNNPNIKLGDLVNKKNMHNFCEKFGITIPKTFFPKNSKDLKDAAEEIGFPCLIKPIFSFLWHNHKIKTLLSGGKVAVCYNYQELIQKYSQLAQFDPRLMIQEIVKGDDNHMYEFSCYISRKGKMLGGFVGRKLRILPPLFGTASLVESVYEPEILSVGVRLLKKIGFSGLANVEFKKDLTDGRVKFIEFNARYGLWDFLGTKSGVNLPYLAYCDLLGKSVSENTKYKTGIKWVSLKDDLYSFVNLRRKKAITFLQWLNSLRGQKAFALLDWHDPLPFLNSTFELAITLFQKHFKAGK